MSHNDYHIRLSVRSGHLLMVSDTSTVPLVDVMIDKIRPISVSSINLENVQYLMKNADEEGTKEFMQTLTDMTHMELARFYCLLQRISNCIISEVESKMNLDDPPRMSMSTEDSIYLNKLLGNNIYIRESDMEEIQ